MAWDYGEPGGSPAFRHLDTGGGECRSPRHGVGDGRCPACNEYAGPRVPVDDDDLMERLKASLRHCEEKPVKHKLAGVPWETEER